MTRFVSVGERSRGGTHGRFPPNPLQWDNERNGLTLRQELGVSDAAMLPHLEAFGLLPSVQVAAHGEIPVAETWASHLRRGGRTAWSGLAIMMADGSELVLYNDSHALTRIRATLMEEFFHIRLNHPRSAIRLLSDGSSTRTLDASVEAAAYGSAAAALVPFRGLKSFLDDGRSARWIAGNFAVSADLVVFRIKVTKQWKYLRR